MDTIDTFFVNEITNVVKCILRVGDKPTSRHVKNIYCRAICVFYFQKIGLSDIYIAQKLGRSRSTVNIIRRKLNDMFAFDKKFVEAFNLCQHHCEIIFTDYTYRRQLFQEEIQKLEAHMLRQTITDNDDRQQENKQTLCGR